MGQLGDAPADHAPAPAWVTSKAPAPAAPHFATVYASYSAAATAASELACAAPNQQQTGGRLWRDECAQCRTAVQLPDPATPPPPASAWSGETVAPPSSNGSSMTCLSSCESSIFASDTSSSNGSSSIGVAGRCAAIAPWPLHAELPECKMVEFCPIAC